MKYADRHLARERALDSLLVITKGAHAGLGLICLVSGAVALLSVKRRGRHPIAGKLFAVSLGLLFLAILPNIMAANNVFLLGLGWLAVYAAFEGWRALRRFRGRVPPEPDAIDYGLNGITVVMSVILIGFGAWVFFDRGHTLGLVCFGFGGLGALLVGAAVGRWRSPPEPRGWLAVHIGLMCGAFSAALTTVLAIQLSGHVDGYEWVLWVTPAVVMSLYGQRELRSRGLRPR